MWRSLGIVAAIVLAGCTQDMLQPTPSGPASASQRCTPTPTTEHSAGRSFAAPIRLVVSGGFAADGRSPDVGTYWYLRDAPQPSIQLRAEPSGGARPVVQFEATGYPLGRGFVRDWDMGWYYRTGVGAEDSLPLPPGCWRVKVVGRPPNDALVYDVPAIGRPAIPRP